MTGPDPNQPSDSQVVEQVLAGDRNAYAILVERYQRKLLGLAYRLLGNRDEAEDVAQEALVKAFQALGRFTLGQPFGPWLYRIASNACTDRLRQRRHTAPAGSDDYRLEQAADEDHTPEEALVRQEQISRLRQAIQALPEAYRQLVVLAHLQHVPYNDLAASTGLPLTVIKNRLYRARLMLKEALEDQGQLKAAAAIPGRG